MWGIAINKHGGTEVLERVEIETPEPGNGQVRVAIRAVALNHLDLWVRRGGPAFRHLTYPHFLGSDIAGVVDAIGPDIDGIEVGQKCIVAPGTSCGICRHCLAGDDNLCAEYKILGENTQGGYREYMVVPARSIAPFPQDATFAEAAAANLTFLTAWQMLVTKANIGPGDTVLIHGAASGVGVAAIQIAKLFHARVIATAGSSDKLAAATDLGADFTINYRETDFREAVETYCGKRSIDIVFEHVGGQVFQDSLKVLRNGGTLVTCGATAGATPQIDLRHVFFRQLNVLGSTMGPRVLVDKISNLVATGKLQPVIHAELPLANAAEAHEMLESRSAIGKIVLTID